MTVYVVNFKSTGETWHSAVCETFDVAKQVMAGYGITEERYGELGEGLWAYVSPTDPSQTASVWRREVVRAR